MAFSEFQINLANFAMHIGQISLAQNVGKIKLQIFFAQRCAPETFCLAHKGW